jgi:hypothetical protein
MSTKRTVKDWIAVVRTGIEVCGIPSKHDVERLLEAIDHATATISTITPAQQAVLDAAVAWRTAYGSLPDSTEQKLALAAAVDAMTRPPSVADRLETWWRKPTDGTAMEYSQQFEALIAEVRALEAGKGKEV